MSDPEGEIRVGLIGYGLGGEVFHAPLIESVPGMRLATVVTSDPERAARASSRYPDARIVGTVEELWKAADEHDLISIVTPNKAHVPLGLAALELGLPIVVDKPLAASAADGHALVDAASKRGLLLSVFQNRRWDNDFLTLRRLLVDGSLGSVHRFESRYERWRPEATLDAWRERGAPDEAGGLLFDLGSHLVDQALVLFGRPRSVYAEVDLRRPGVEADDDVFVALEHPGGVRTHLWASVMAGIFGPRFRVLGTGGAYVKYGLDVQEDALAAGRSPKDVGWGVEPESAWGVLGLGADTEPVPSEPGAYQEFYRGIAEALRTGGPPPVDPGDSVAGLEVLEAARESARARAVVALAGA